MNKQRFPALHKVLAKSGQAEIDSVVLSYMLDKQFDDADWEAWDDVKEEIADHIQAGLGDGAEDIEFDEMAGMVSLSVVYNLPLGTTTLPDDLVPKFQKLVREALLNASF